MARWRPTTGLLIAICLCALLFAVAALHVLQVRNEAAAVARAEHDATSRWIRIQADALETDLRRVLMLTERAKQPGASRSRIDLAIAEHDSLQHEIALLEASAEWGASAATLFDLRQLLSRQRERLLEASAAAARNAAATLAATAVPVRGLTGDAPQAITLFEQVRAQVLRSLSDRGMELQRQQRRLDVLMALATAGFMLVVGGCGLALYLLVTRPLAAIRAALRRASIEGGCPAPAAAGCSDIAGLASQARDLVAQADERQLARVTALREQFAAQAARLQGAERARQAAEQASRDRSDFIVQLGHELRTPLTGMLGLVDLLAAEVGSDTGQRRLQSIQGAALLLRGVLDRMTEASTSRAPQAVAADLSPRHAGEGLSAAVTEPPRATSTEQRQPGARVLVAEDHAINQVVISEMLEHLGHAVEVVPDGRRAVERVRDRLFDVVLMDWAMPEMDGVEATRLIRAEESRSGRARVPIIALSAHTIAEHRRECLAAGMDDFLAKPVSVDALDAAIRRAVA